MSSYWDLYFYLKTLHILGLLCCQYKKETDTNQLNLTKSNEMQALFMFCLVQFFLIFMLQHCVLHIKDFHLNVHNKTGNQYFAINFIIACILLSILYIYFYTNRKRHIKFLLIILNYHKENCFQTSKDNSKMFSFRSNFFTYVGVCVMFTFIYQHAFGRSALTPLAMISHTIVFSSVNIICGIILLFYVCIVKILQFSLKHLNDQLRDVATNSITNKKYFKEMILKRNQLLTFCYRDINQRIGFVILIIIIYVIFTAPSGPFFFISVILEETQEGQILAILIPSFVSLFWTAPWFALIAVISACAGISVEAKKTTQIILRNQSTQKNGVQKVIDKFLLKNLQQKPVLNAWGFITLEKQTLFQLLASIATYMMILVQFKEMENQTKN